MGGGRHPGERPGTTGEVVLASAALLLPWSAAARFPHFGRLPPPPLPLPGPSRGREPGGRRSLEVRAGPEGAQRPRTLPQIRALPVPSVGHNLEPSGLGSWPGIPDLPQV